MAGFQQLWALTQSHRGSQASCATWNWANSNEGKDLIKYNLTKPAIFNCVASGERMSLVITKNSSTPSIGF